MNIKCVICDMGAEYVANGYSLCADHFKSEQGYVGSEKIKYGRNWEDSKND